MNLFNGRLAKPLTTWCCERGQRDGVEVCVDCRQSLEDWRALRSEGSWIESDSEPLSHDVTMEPEFRPESARSHPIFTEAQLEKLAQANALDELLGIDRGRKK